MPGTHSLEKMNNKNLKHIYFVITNQKLEPIMQKTAAIIKSKVKYKFGQYIAKTATDISQMV